jgi:hypothetical protein
MNTYILEEYLLSVNKWHTVGDPSTCFGTLYRELHAKRQHPHGHLKIVDKKTGEVIMHCWDNGFIEPFQHGKYTDWTGCNADFDE